MGEVGDPVRDWLDASAAVRPGIDAVLERSRREGTDLILEGVHLLPSLDLLRSWSGDGGIAVGIVLHCEVERTHRERILARESNTYRTASRYLAAMDRIRAIQDAVVDRGRQWVAPSLGADTRAGCGTNRGLAQSSIPRTMREQPLTH